MSKNLYHPKCFWLHFRFWTAIIGIILGCSASVAFAIVFHNYHCSGWAFVSAVFAATTLAMHVKVYRDVTYSIQPTTFQRLKYLGIFGALIGFGAFVGYLVKGMLVHETGVVIKGWFIVTVWSFMTWKWGFLLFWFSNKYSKALVDEVTEILAVNQSEYES